MKSNRHIASTLMVLMLASVMCLIMSLSASASTYEYTVTISGGRQGTVSNSSFKVAKGGTITIDPNSVTIINDKYYLKGFHISGQETPVVQAGDIPNITEDMDFVATYGIKQEMVAYVVKYVDENDDEILDAKTFYGNIGDKPVLAYTHIDNYRPKAYAITKTLTDTESDNVFVFKYTSEQAAEEDDENDDDENDSSDRDNDDDDDGTDNTGGNGGTNAAGNGNNGGWTPGAGGNVFQNGNDNDDSDGDSDYSGPGDTVDLDDPAAPKADGSGNASKGGSSGAGLIAGGTAAAIALLLLIIFFVKRSAKH